MSVKRIRSLIRAYSFLRLLRSKQGERMSHSTLRSIRRIAAYRILKVEHRRLTRLLQLARRRRPRRWHVRPIFVDHDTHGAWHTLIPIMRQFDRDEHFKFLRMTPESFDFLLELVSPVLEKKSYRKSISAGERLAVTLRYLASGDSMASLSYLFRISNQAISQIVLETTAAIWFALKDLVFEPLSPEFWMKKAAKFETMAQFPLCVGAMDGKHCFVQKFAMRGSEYYNYKHGHSLILFAVSDAKYKFVVVDVGARGRESDGGVFDRSGFGQLFANKLLQLPQPVYNEDVKSHLPYVFLGDDAFPLGENLMKPFDDNICGKPEEIIFNYRLSRGRRVVENAFGILSARFRILRKSIIGNEILAQNIILATTALHNFHLMREDSIPPKQRLYVPDGYDDTFRSNGKMKKGRWRNEVKHLERTVFRKLRQQEMGNDIGNVEEGDAVREKFVQLFVASILPWQYDNLPQL